MAIVHRTIVCRLMVISIVRQLKNTKVAILRKHAPRRAAFLGHHIVRKPSSRKYQNIEDKPIGNVKNGVKVTTSVTAAGKTCTFPRPPEFVSIQWHDCTLPSQAHTCWAVLISTPSFRVTSIDQRFREVIPLQVAHLLICSHISATSAVRAPLSYIEVSFSGT